MAKTPARPPARPAPKPAPAPEVERPQDDPDDPAPPADPDTPATPPPPRLAARSEPALRVRAVHDGYYDNKYRRTGDVFTLARGERPARWMAAVDPDTPEHTTSHGQALQAQREDVMTQRAIERGGAAGVHAPIDTPDDGLDPIGAREG